MIPEEKTIPKVVISPYHTYLGGGETKRERRRLVSWPTHTHTHTHGGKLKRKRKKNKEEKVESKLAGFLVPK